MAAGRGGERPDLERRILVVLAAMLLCGLVFAVYWPVLHHPFTGFDDNLYVTENRTAQRALTWAGLRYAFTSQQGFWQPVVWVVLMLEATVFGVDPRAFHLVNLLLHAANTLLLFRVALRLSSEAVSPSGYDNLALALEVAGRAVVVLPTMVLRGGANRMLAERRTGQPVGTADGWAGQEAPLEPLTAPPPA